MQNLSNNSEISWKRGIDILHRVGNMCLLIKTFLRLFTEAFKLLEGKI